MTDNRKKGIAFIIGGILSLIIIPFILQLIGLYMISYYLRSFFLIHIIAIVLIGFGIKTLINRDVKDSLATPKKAFTLTGWIVGTYKTLVEIALWVFMLIGGLGAPLQAPRLITGS